MRPRVSQQLLELGTRAMANAGPFLNGKAGRIYKAQRFSFSRRQLRERESRVAIIWRMKDRPLRHWL